MSLVTLEVQVEVQVYYFRSVRSSVYEFVISHKFLETQCDDGSLFSSLPGTIQSSISWLETSQLVQLFTHSLLLL